MRITVKELKSLDPCTDGLEWYMQHGTEDLLETLLKVNEYRSYWARWLFTKLMSRKQCLEIAIYSAELVLPIFENKYPQDNRPRAAIDAAKAVLRDDTKENREAARIAAYAAYAAANAADYAAHAAYAANYAANALVNKKDIQEKIIKMAVEILEREK